jgi:hypothetical protein
LALLSDRGGDAYIVFVSAASPVAEINGDTKGQLGRSLLFFGCSLTPAEVSQHVLAFVSRSRSAIAHRQAQLIL